MKMNSEEVRNYPRGYRQLQAEIKKLDVHARSLMPKQAEQKRDQLKQLTDRCQIIDSWLQLLSDDEAFIVEQHLIAGVDMVRLEQVYREKWGELGKSERTLRRYQKRAIEKIIHFMNDDGA